MNSGNFTSFGAHVWTKLEQVQSQAFVGESIAGMPVADIKKFLRASKKKHAECIKIIDKLLKP